MRVYNICILQQKIHCLIEPTFEGSVHTKLFLISQSCEMLLYTVLPQCNGGDWNCGCGAQITGNNKIQYFFLLLK